MPPWPAPPALPRPTSPASAATANGAFRRTPATQVRLETEVRGSAITIIERRAPWREDFGPEWSRRKAARLRYDHGSWTLHWADRNGRWLPYPDLDPSPRLDDLLAEIDRDPAGAFWG
jgi:Protein of unknown function (DUF3024)